MRIVIVGAPGVGKNELAFSLHDALAERGYKLPITGSSNDFMATFGKAVGILADYRVELSLAVRRAFMMEAGTDAIYEGSLLDSVAHAAARYKILYDQAAAVDQEQYEWWLVLQNIATMVRDTFVADYIFYIVPTAELEGYKQHVDEAIFWFLGECGLEFATIFQDDLSEENLTATVEDIVNGIIDGENSKSIAAEPDGEDIESGL